MLIGPISESESGPARVPLRHCAFCDVSPEWNLDWAPTGCRSGRPRPRLELKRNLNVASPVHWHWHEAALETVTVPWQ